MSSSSSMAWMPPKGRRSVNAGSSLIRALNARKSKGTAPATKSLYLRDFYSFRYNFRPPSVDPGERGRIIVKKGKDSTSVTVERPSTQPSEAHQWLGTEIPAKEWDCVLIYDEASDTYTLEKLDSHMVLTHQHKPVPIEPVVPTPPAEPPTKRTLSYDEELERELVAAAGGDEDADGDDDFEEIVPKVAAARMEEEEEEEEEMLKPPSPPPPPPPKPVRPAKAPAPPTATPSSSTQKPRTWSAAAARPKAAPSARAKKTKRESEPAPVSNGLSDADEEDLEFGRPAKRARSSEGLALPSSSTAVYTPPPPLPHVSRPSPPPPPPPPVAEPGSESEEEWDEVAAVGDADAGDVEDDFDIFGDAAMEGGDAEGDGEDIDVNEFEREINQQMEEESDDDFLAAVVEEAPSVPRGAPKSLKELASGAGAAYASDDDYSSSEESDDD